MQAFEQPVNSSVVPEELRGLDEFIIGVMEDWQLPGLAIGVVKDGEMVCARAFGKRNVAEGLDVTPNTLFAIGSCTKAFTTMILGMLADEGKLDWDVPIRKYIPKFKMHDLFASERMTARDLATHRSGLPRYDFVWYRAKGQTREELIEKLQYLEPNKDFRTVWQYQNLMYMTAGYLAEVITGKRWEELVQQRIFAPLGMTSSNISIHQSKQSSDFSLPYRKEKGAVIEIPFYGEEYFQAIAPAGAINSNVLDMSAWMLLHLNKGKRGEQQFISESQIAQMHASYIPIPAVALSMPEVEKGTEITCTGYGLGWITMSYRGHYRLSHSGGIDGFSALTTLLPDANIGIVVLTNRENCPAHSIITNYVCDFLLGMELVPWNERLKKDFAALEELQKKAKESAASDRVPDTHPSHALDDYTGDYEHPALGTLTIKQDGEQLAFVFNDLAAPLTHYHYDVFEAKLERFEIDAKLSFSTNLKGDIESVTVPLEPMAKPIVFTRVASQELMNRAFLEQFVGVYEVVNMRITVALKGEQRLAMTVPGQPEYELIPFKGTTFQLKGLSGYSVEFKYDEAGTVSEAVFTQPFGTVSVKKVGE